MKNARAGGIFSRILAKPEASSSKPDIDESVLGKTFSPELFKEELKDLGYNFEIFVDKENKIYRFSRFVAPDVNTTGDVW